MGTLRVWPVLREAVSRPWDERRHFGPLLTLPTIIFIIDTVIEEQWLIPLVESGIASMMLDSLGHRLFIIPVMVGPGGKREA